MQSQNSFDGRVVVAVGLIALGVLFFIAQFTGWNLFAWIWPLFIIIPGLAMFVPVMNGREAGLAVPASIVTGTGLLLFYQSVTGNWGSWAYAWTLYGVFLGFGLWLTGRLRGDAGTRQTGEYFMLGGLVAFAFFFLLFGGFGVLWPLILIGVGVYLLFRAMGGRLPENLDRAIRPASMASSAPARRAVAGKPAETSLADRFANEPLQKEIAAALAGEEPAQAEPAPSAGEAQKLAADLEAEIKAAAAAAETMIASDEDDEEDAK